MSEEDIKTFKKDQIIPLIGYTSTSKHLALALKFAFSPLDSDSNNLQPVIFKIKFRGNSGLFELDDELTAYPGENEVLLQDGLKYRVLRVTDFLT